MSIGLPPEQSTGIDQMFKEMVFATEERKCKDGANSDVPYLTGCTDEDNSNVPPLTGCTNGENSDVPSLMQALKHEL